MNNRSNLSPELASYVQFFADLHRDAAELLEGLPPEALNWRPIEGDTEDDATNSIAATLTHAVGAERLLVGQLAGGRPANRDRDAEFRAVAAGPEELKARLQAADELVESVLAGLSPENLDETVDHRGRMVTRRWAIVHALEHTAQHLGHVQLTRQLWRRR